MRNRFVVLGSAVFASLFIVVAVSSQAAAANLVKNPSFEVGAFSYWAHNDKVSIDGFMYHRNGLKSVYVQGDFGSTTQRVSVAGFATLIDANKAAVSTGCYHAGYEPVYVTATFLNAAGQAIGAKSVSSAAPMSFTTWKRAGLVRVAIPPKTRSIRLTIRVKDVPEGMADTNWDDAYLVVMNR